MTPSCLRLWFDWLPLDTEPPLTCFQMMPRCCMDAWAVVMSDQAIKQATHARTIERDSRPHSHCTICDHISFSLAIEPASSVYCNTDLDGDCVVRHVGHGDGRDKAQTGFSIPHWHAHGYGVGVLKMWGCRPPEHKRQAEFNSTGLDPKNKVTEQQ